MDKISELLAEAGPLYRKRRKARQFAAGTLCSLLCGVWFGAAVLLPERAADETQLEAYYAVWRRTMFCRSTGTAFMRSADGKAELAS